MSHEGGATWRTCTQRNTTAREVSRSPQVRDAMSRTEAQQPSRGRTTDLRLWTELLKKSFSQLPHTKTTNSGCCPSKFVSHCISVLVLCTARYRVAHPETLSQGSDVHSKALLYQCLHVLHDSCLLHCRECLRSALSPHKLTSAVCLCRASSANGCSQPFSKAERPLFSAQRTSSSSSARLCV